MAHSDLRLPTENECRAFSVTLFLNQNLSVCGYSACFGIFDCLVHPQNCAKIYLGSGGRDQQLVRKN